MMENPEFAEKMHYWVVKRKRMPESQYILSYIIATFGPKQTTEFLTEIIEYVQKSSQSTESPVEPTEPLTESTDPSV